MNRVIFALLGIAIVLVLLLAKICKSGAGAKRLIGESGIVLSDISLDHSGVIKLNGKEYLAASDDGEEIPKNCKAIVKKVSDEKLFVERIKL